jgi:hypothetical protein
MTEEAFFEALELASVLLKAYDNSKAPKDSKTQLANFSFQHPNTWLMVWFHEPTTESRYCLTPRGRDAFCQSWVSSY